MKSPNPPASKSLSRSFTLIELIVVIIIVGILAAVGISQYSKMVEKGRGAEARMILGGIRTLGLTYYQENGTTAGITNADVNIGTAPDQIPSACRSSHYFLYYVIDCGVACLDIKAYRCDLGGKSPQGVASNYLILRAQYGQLATTWSSNAGY